MAFLLLIIYVTILLVRPQEWYESLAGWELVNLAAILTIVATFITRQRSKQSLSDALVRDRYARLQWGLLAAVVLSQLVTLRLRGAFEAFQDFGKICVLFFLTMTLVDQPNRLRRMMWVVVSCATLLSIHGIMQARLGYGLGKITPQGSFAAGTFRVRGSGIFNDPNDFALLFIAATPFVLSLMRMNRSVLLKIPLLLVLPGFLFVLYHTQSRGAVVGFCAMLLAYLWQSGKRTLPRLVLTAGLIAAAVALGPARARETVYEGSAEGRISEWGAGNLHLKQNPFFGIGYGRWGDFESKAAHSSFVNCYAELGLVGYFFWFGLCWFVVRGLQRIRRLSSELDPGICRLAEGLFAALVGYLTASFFLTRTYNPVLFLLLGLGAALIRYVQSQPGVQLNLFEITAGGIRRAFVVTLLTIPAIWVVIRLYWAGAFS